MIALQLEQLKQQQHIKLQQQQYQQQLQQQQQFQQVQQLQQQPQFMQAGVHESSVALELSELPNLITPKDVTISTDQQTTSPHANQYELTLQQNLLQQQQQQQEQQEQKMQELQQQQQMQELQLQLSSTQPTDSSEKQQSQEQHQVPVQTFVQTTDQSATVTDSQAPANETVAVEMPSACEVTQAIESTETSSSSSNIKEVQPLHQLPVDDQVQEATNNDNPESSLIRSDSSQKQSPQIQLQQNTQLSPALVAQPQQVASSPGQPLTETTKLVSTTPTAGVTNSPSILQQQRAASIASNQSPTLRSPLRSPSIQLVTQQQQQQQQQMLVQQQQQRLQYQPIQLLNLQNSAASNVVVGKS